MKHKHLRHDTYALSSVCLRGYEAARRHHSFPVMGAGSCVFLPDQKTTSEIRYAEMVVSLPMSSWAQCIYMEYCIHVPDKHFAVG